MAKFLVLFALCCVLLPAISTARLIGNPFHVKGRVYCDACRAGFETTATNYLAGAKVRIECKDRATLQLRYTVEGVTDATGCYDLTVADDHGDQLCEAILVSSPDPQCAEPNAGRDRATVILTRNNGMISDTRFANNMGFLKSQPLAGCTQLIRSYLQEEDN